jgi:glycosyltransferase involved in cell wall biosynthesis
MTRPIRVLELRSVRGTGGGPEKTILHGAARTDVRRFAVTVCYLRDARDSVFSMAPRAAALGIDYVELTERHSFDPSIFGTLRSLIAARGIDIVHAHDYKTDALTLLLSRSADIVPLATVHGWTGQSFRERFVYYPIDKRILARFPHLIAVSSDIRAELVRCGARADRVSVVLNGIDHRRFAREARLEEAARAQVQASPSDLVVGAVGRLERQKRFDVLIEAVAALVPRHPTIKLVIAGGGSLRAALERQAAARLPSGVCRFLGDTADIVGLHHAFDVFVQSSEYEGTPNAILEAMALGTPIVATDVGGTTELAAPDEHALIVAPGQAALLADAISLSLVDRAGARRRAALARLRVEESLSFESRMSAVERVYEQVAPSAARTRREGRLLRWI